MTVQQSGNVEQIVGYADLDFRREIRLRGTDLGDINVKMIPEDIDVKERGKKPTRLKRSHLEVV